MIIIIFIEVLNFSHGQVHEVLLHFIIVLGLLKKLEAKKLSILEKMPCTILTCH